MKTTLFTFLTLLLAVSGMQAQDYQATVDTVYARNVCYEKNGNPTYLGNIDRPQYDKQGNLVKSPSEWQRHISYWTSGELTLAYYVHLPAGKVRADMLITTRSGKTATLAMKLIDPTTATTLVSQNVSIGQAGKQQTVECLPATDIAKDGWYRLEFTCNGWSTSFSRFDYITFQRTSTDAICTPRIYSALATYLNGWRSTDADAPAGASYDWCYLEVKVPKNLESINSYTSVMGLLGGYLGIQSCAGSSRSLYDGFYHNVIFSMWDNGDRDKTPYLPAYLRSGAIGHHDSAKINYFGNEGTGVQSMLGTGDWWQPDEWVQMLFTCRPEEVSVTLQDVNGNDSVTFNYSNTLVSLWFKQAGESEWHYQATLRKSGLCNYVDGWHSFLENWSPTAGQFQRTSLFRNAYMRSIASGKWYHRNQITSGYYYDPSRLREDLRDRRTDFDFGLSDEEPGAFYMTSGGFVNTNDGENRTYTVPLATDQTCVDTIDVQRLLREVDSHLLAYERDSVMARRLATATTADALKALAKEYLDQADRFNGYSSADLANLREVYADGNATNSEALRTALADLSAKTLPLRYSSVQRKENIGTFRAYRLHSPYGLGEVVAAGGTLTARGATDASATANAQQPSPVTDDMGNWILARSESNGTYMLYNIGLKKYLDMSQASLLSEEPVSVEVTRVTDGFTFKQGSRYLAIAPSAAVAITTSASATNATVFELLDNVAMQPADELCLEVLNHASGFDGWILHEAATKTEVWKYTATEPAADWMNFDFDDSQWQEGPSGFGVSAYRKAWVNTLYSGAQGLWLRKDVTLDVADVRQLSFSLCYDEDPVVYINGVKAFEAKGWKDNEYVNITSAMSSEALQAINLHGTNTIAIHFVPGAGGSCLDLSIECLDANKFELQALAKSVNINDYAYDLNDEDFMGSFNQSSLDESLRSVTGTEVGQVITKAQREELAAALDAANAALDSNAAADEMQQCLTRLKTIKEACDKALDYKAGMKAEDCATPLKEGYYYIISGLADDQKTTGAKVMSYDSSSKLFVKTAMNGETGNANYLFKFTRNGDYWNVKSVAAGRYVGISGTGGKLAPSDTPVDLTITLTDNSIIMGGKNKKSIRFNFCNAAGQKLKWRSLPNNTAIEYLGPSNGDTWEWRWVWLFRPVSDEVAALAGKMELQALANAIAINDYPCSLNDEDFMAGSFNQSSLDPQLWSVTGYEVGQVITADQRQELLDAQTAALEVVADNAAGSEEVAVALQRLEAAKAVCDQAKSGYQAGMKAEDCANPLTEGYYYIISGYADDQKTTGAKVMRFSDGSKLFEKTPLSGMTEDLQHIFKFTRNGNYWHVQNVATGQYVGASGTGGKLAPSDSPVDLTITLTDDGTIMSRLNKKSVRFNFCNTAGTKLKFRVDNGNSNIYYNASGYEWFYVWLFRPVSEEVRMKIDQLPMTVAAAGFSTFYRPFDVEVIGDATAYSVGDVKNGYAIFTPLEGNRIPANTGAVVKGNIGDYIVLYNASAATVPAANYLLGSNEDITVEAEPGYEYFISGRVGTAAEGYTYGWYYPYGITANGQFINHAHKAYIKVPSSMMPAEAKGLGMVWGDDPTGISTMHNAQCIMHNDQTVYDLQGRKVADNYEFCIMNYALPKGVYIVNGKKIVVK